MSRRFASMLTSLTRRYRRSDRGAAAAEFAIMLPLLVLPLLNAVDFGVYAYDRMETGHAAQSAAQAAWADCAANDKVPATAGTNTCTLWTGGDEANIAHGTTLGTAVSVSNSEGFYCLKGTTLVSVGTFPTTEPSDCSGVVKGSTDTPGDYVFVTATFSFKPIFEGVSFLGPRTITEEARMRLN